MSCFFLHLLALSLASLSLLGAAAGNKYCGRAPFRKNGKFCCERDRAWDSKATACSNGGSYIKIHDNCGVEGRRRRAKQRICCDKLNAFQTCSQPTPSPTPAPTAAPTPAPTAAPTPAPTAAPTPAPTAAPTPAPTPTPSPSLTPTAAPTAAYNSTSTRYFADDSHGTIANQQGACGGADLDQVSSTLAGLTDTLGMHYFAVAIAQGMGEPFMCNADESVGKGVPSRTGRGYDNVLHAYCGQCIEFTTETGVKVGGLVMDTCPTVDATGNDNSEFCSKSGTANKHGYHNHLDIHGTSSDSVSSVIGDNPVGTIQLVECPAALSKALTDLAAASRQSPASPVCSWWYDTSSGTWQGAPGMDEFGCSECSDSRRLFSESTRTVLV